MKRWGYWAVIGAVLLALVALIGWSSTYTPLLTPRASEEWSRGRLLGVTPVNVRVDIQPAPDGGVFLTWADLDDRLRLVRLGTRGQVVVDRTLALGTGVPRTPRFLVGPGGEIHLIWREADAGHSRLAYARLSGEGSVQVGPLALSPPGDEVKAFDLAFNRQGGIEVFWAGGAGIYRVAVNTEGETLGEPALLVEGGESINLQVDQAGIFHLAWIQKVGSNTSAIYYSSFDPEQETLGQPEEMGRVFLRTGQSLQDVVVGVDSDTGYVLWIIQDLKAISSSGRYVFFPLEIPRQKRIRSVRLNDGANPLSPWPVRGQYETLLVALTETIMTSDGPQLQVAIVALHGEEPPATYASAALQSRGSTLAAAQDDWPEDQVVVTASDRPSLKPSLAVDAHDFVGCDQLDIGRRDAAFYGGGIDAGAGYLLVLVPFDVVASLSSGYRTGALDQVECMGGLRCVRVVGDRVHISDLSLQGHYAFRAPVDRAADHGRCCAVVDGVLSVQAR